MIIRGWMRNKKTDRLVPHPFRDWGDQSRCVFPRDRNDYIVLLSSHRATTVIVRVAARQKSTGCSFAEINNKKCPRNSSAFVWRRENFEAGVRTLLSLKVTSLRYYRFALIDLIGYANSPAFLNFGVNSRKPS